MKNFLLLLLFLPGFLQAQIIQGINMAAPGSAPTGAYATTPTSQSGYVSTAGAAGTAKSATVSGANITATTTWTAPTGYEVSFDNTVFANQITMSASNGGIAGQPVTFWVRLLAGNAAGTYNGNSVQISSANATTYNFAVNGTTTSASSPATAPTPASLTGFATTIGVNSTSKNGLISGTNLTANIVGTASSTDWQVSPDNTNWSSTVTYTQSGGNVASTPFYARLTSAASAGSKTGTITWTSAGAGAQTTNLTGNVSTAGTNDTVNVNLFDTLRTGNAGKYTAPDWNNWGPVAPATGLVSAPLKYSTGVQSPIQISIDVLNDYSTSATANWGTGNTMGYPAFIFQTCAFNTTSNANLKWTGLTPSTGSYRVEIVSSTTAGATYNCTFTIGAQNASANAGNNLSNLIVLDNITPDASGNITIVCTMANGFSLFNAVRLIRKNP